MSADRHPRRLALGEAVLEEAYDDVHAGRGHKGCDLHLDDCGFLIN